MVLNLNLGKVVPKTTEEIKIMRIGGLIWQAIRNSLIQNVKVGMSLFDVEELAKKQFKIYGLESSFDKVGSFPSIICLSLNNCVVHGSASNKLIKEGDKLTIDLGFKFQGMNIDAAFSLFFDTTNENEETKEKGKKIEEYRYINQLTTALFYEAIHELKAGKTNGFVTEKIENVFKKYFPKKYSFLDKFTGHGIGKELHEFPRIHNFGLSKEEGTILPANCTICIEPMIVEQKDGSWIQDKNDPGIYIKDKNAITIHYEHLVLVLEEGVEILTASLWEREEMKSAWEIIKSV